jgi:arylsulfatase A-like enzyme
MLRARLTVPVRAGPSATNQDSTGVMKPSVETMLPKILKTAGYVTGMAGKWGQLPLGPAEFGFDEFMRFSGRGVYWKPPGADTPIGRSRSKGTEEPRRTNSHDQPT